ncbi:unnamed protein product [Arctogadus glacialis]
MLREQYLPDDYVVNHREPLSSAAEWRACRLCGAICIEQVGPLSDFPVSAGDTAAAAAALGSPPRLEHHAVHLLTSSSTRKVTGPFVSALSSLPRTPEAQL